MEWALSGGLTKQKSRVVLVRSGLRLPSLSSVQRGFSVYKIYEPRNLVKLNGMAIFGLQRPTVDQAEANLEAFTENWDEMHPG